VQSPEKFALQRRIIVKFLAISQDNLLVNSMCTEFKQQGYEVFQTCSLQEAELICKNKALEVIVADHLQTDGNFFDFYDNLKATSRIGLPPVAIVLSPADGSLTPEVALAMGAWALFIKPFQMKTLYASVEDAVFSRRAGYTKRLDERVELTAKVFLKSSSAQDFIPTFLTNMSFGGFFAALQKDFPKIGEKVQFKIYFSSSDVLEGEGKVTWVRQEPKEGTHMGCGVQFSLGREKYVKILVPIINEARTRQMESSAFQEEDLNDILVQSLQAAKEKISKKVTEIHFKKYEKKIKIMCRHPQILSVFTWLIYELIYPMREIKNSKCQLSFVVHEKEQNVRVLIDCSPSGASFFIDQLIAEKVQPILDEHKGTIHTEFNSLQSNMTITLKTVSKN
jgi:hypothetical protein